MEHAGLHRDGGVDRRVGHRSLDGLELGAIRPPPRPRGATPFAYSSAAQRSRAGTSPANTNNASARAGRIRSRSAGRQPWQHRGQQQERNDRPEESAHRRDTGQESAACSSRTFSITAACRATTVSRFRSRLSVSLSPASARRPPLEEGVADVVRRRVAHLVVGADLVQRPRLQHVERSATFSSLVSFSRLSCGVPCEGRGPNGRRVQVVLHEQLASWPRRTSGRRY